MEPVLVSFASPPFSEARPQLQGDLEEGRCCLWRLGGHCGQDFILEQFSTPPLLSWPQRGRSSIPGGS